MKENERERTGEPDDLRTPKDRDAEIERERERGPEDRRKFVTS